MSRNCNNFSGGDTEYQDGSFAAPNSKMMYPPQGYYLLSQDKTKRWTPTTHLSREELADLKRHFDMCQEQERVQHLAERAKLKLYNRGNINPPMFNYPEKVGDSNSSHKQGLLPPRLSRPMHYEQRYNVAPKLPEGHNNRTQHISLTHDILQDAFMSNNQIRERQAQARKLSEKQQFETVQAFSGLKEPSKTKVHQKQPEMHLRKSKSCQKFSNFSVQNDEHAKCEMGDYFSEVPKPNDKHEFGIDAESVMMKEENNPKMIFPDHTNPNEDILDSGTVVCSASYVKERPSYTKSNVYVSDGKESIRSHKTSSSRSSNKSSKTIEDSIELQRKKSSLIEFIEKSLSKSHLDKTESDSSTKVKPQNEFESNKINVCDTCSNPNCLKTDKDKQVDKTQYSELLTNTFKNCRVYHLQHIQEEVNRILYLEKLPEEINKSS